MCELRTKIGGLVGDGSFLDAGKCWVERAGWWEGEDGVMCEWNFAILQEMVFFPEYDNLAHHICNGLPWFFHRRP